MNDRRLLVEFGPRNPEYGNKCIDCKKPVGARMALVCRGVNDAGEFDLFMVCPKCAARDIAEAVTGVPRHRRIRLWLAQRGIILKRKKAPWNR